MSYFTWKEDGLTGDCQTLEAMASRYEESAKLLRKMSKAGFYLNNHKKKRTINHKDKNTFISWGFTNEESPFLQLTLIKHKEMTGSTSDKE